MIAALFVERGGVYWDLPDVDPWDVTRDARLYAGQHPVVAHPPCERWGRYWGGGPSAKIKRKLGDDGGCFSLALEAVRCWGGVLEHPEASHAWKHFGLIPPLRGGGWSVADEHGGWTCCVEQGAYGHKARKATWLYAVDCDLPILTWESPLEHTRLDAGFHSKAERAASTAPPTKRLTRAECLATPPAFRDVLLSMARTVSSARSAA